MSEFEVLFGRFRPFQLVIKTVFESEFMKNTDGCYLKMKSNMRVLYGKGKCLKYRECDRTKR